MAVLLIAQVFPPRHGGTGRWMWELYRRIVSTDVVVAAGHTGGSEAFDRYAGIRIDRLSLDFPHWGVASPAGLGRYLRAFRHVFALARTADVTAVHCAKCLPEGLIGLSVARRAGVPYWCYVHGEELTLARTSRELRFLTGIVLRGAARVVANSRFTASLLQGDWSLDPEIVRVVPPGVDTERFRVAPRSEEERARLGWAGRRVVLTVGALQKRKGQDMLIRALPAILRACPDVLYAIAGEGWERRYLEDIARDVGVSDYVQFRGTPSDAELVSCYQQCDLFALPNRQIGWDVEGFGIVLAEAQACGAPVLTGMSGGTGDTLVPGVTGEIVNSTEPSNIANAIIDILRDDGKREAMARAARQWATERFDWTTLATSVDRLIAAPAPVATGSANGA